MSQTETRCAAKGRRQPFHLGLTAIGKIGQNATWTVVVVVDIIDNENQLKIPGGASNGNGLRE
ncbi:hypothetical protein ABEW34_22925 [Paenibacillus algorifonticola]|uniref:hypothetical protein n=1 Tax=Paenibacillus algorifonticola TaxID=684063 RepID=UPI003D2C67AB